MEERSYNDWIDHLVDSWGIENHEVIDGVKYNYAFIMDFNRAFNMIHRSNEITMNYNSEDLILLMKKYRVSSCQEDPTKILYFARGDKKRISVKPGRGFRKMFPFLDDVQVEYLDSWYKESYVLKDQEYYFNRGSSRSTFKHVYSRINQGKMSNPEITISSKSLIRSCMRHRFDINHSHYNGYHPVECFASGDFELFWLTDSSDSLVARCTARKVFNAHGDIIRYDLGPVYGVSNFSNSEMIKQIRNNVCDDIEIVEFSDKTCWSGARLLILGNRSNENKVILPYLDTNSKGVQISDDFREWIISSNDLTLTAVADSQKGYVKLMTWRCPLNGEFFNIRDFCYHKGEMLSPNEIEKLNLKRCHYSNDLIDADMAVEINNEYDEPVYIHCDLFRSNCNDVQYGDNIGKFYMSSNLRRLKVDGKNLRVTRRWSKENVLNCKWKDIQAHKDYFVTVALDRSNATYHFHNDSVIDFMKSHRITKLVSSGKNVDPAILTLINEGI